MKLSRILVLTIFLVISSQIQAAKATDFPVKYTIDLEDSRRKLVAPLSDFKNSTAVQINLEKFGRMYIELGIDINQGEELYKDIFSNLELQLVDAEQNAVVSHTNLEARNLTDSIELTFRRISDIKTYYLIVNSSDQSLFESDIDLVFSFNRFDTSGEEIGDFSKATNLGFLSPGKLLEKEFKDPDFVRSSFLHFYKFDIPQVQNIQIKKLSGKGKFVLYDTDKRIIDKGQSLDLVLDVGQYFLEISRWSNSVDSNGIALSPDYKFLVDSRSDPKIREAELAVELLRNDGSIFKDSKPAFFTTNSSGVDKIYSSFKYEKLNETKVGYVFDLNFGNKSSKCKKKKNKKSLSICTSSVGTLVRSFRAGHTESVVSMVNIRKAKKRKITGVLDLSHSTRGLLDKMQAFKGELVSGRFVLKIPKKK